MNSALSGFLELLPDLPTPEAVADALVGRVGPLGLDRYVFGEVPNPSNPLPSAFFRSSLPERWHEAYSEMDFAPIDPVVRAGLLSAVPIRLSEIRAGRAGIGIGGPEQKFFDVAESLGVLEGMIVPVYGPRGHRGLVCLVGKGPGPEGLLQPMLHICAVYAYFRMFQLHSGGHLPGDGAYPTGRSPLLSTREVEVLRLSRGGAADSRIAHELGISVRTVRFHFSNARAKLGCRTRTETILKANSRNLLDS